MHATELLRLDHATVREMLTELKALGPREGDARQALLDRVADALDAHSQLEEELFYPAVRRVSGRIDAALGDHREIDRILDDIAGRLPSTRQWADTLRDLIRAVDEHIDEEEEGIFVDAQRLGATELERLGQSMQARQATLRTSVIQRGRRALRRLDRKTA